MSPPLIRRTARAQRGALLTLGLLVLITSFLVDAGPRTLVRGYDRAARDTITSAPSGSADLVVSADLDPVVLAGQPSRTVLASGTADGLTRLERLWREGFPRPLRDTIETSDHVAGTDFMPLAGRSEQKLSLVLSGTVNEHIRYVAGRPPGTPESGSRLQAALPVRAAQRLGVKAGDVVVTESRPALSVRITGLYAPADPDRAYWTRRPDHYRLKDAELQKNRVGDEVELATALVGPSGYRALVADGTFQLRLVWTYSPAPGRFTARSAPVLAEGVHRAAETLATARVDSTAPVLTTRLDELLDDFSRRLGTAQTLLSLSLAGLFAAALGMLVLAARLLLARLATDLATQAARGASRAQLTGLAAGLASMATLPAAAAGLALSALFVPGPAQTLSYVAASVLVTTAIALPSAGAGRPFRRRRRAARTSHRRLVAEALVVSLAVAGTWTLRRRGLTTETWTAGIDPFLSAVPALLAVATGLLVLRLLPHPLRLAGRVLARGRSTVRFVGVARASSQDSTAVLPLVIVLLAVAVIGFGSTVRTSLDHAQRLATYQAVGGDARVDMLTMTQAVVDRIRHSPGVRTAVSAQTVEGADLYSGTSAVDELTVVGVDLSAYHRMMAGTGLRIPAWPRTRPGDPVPALFSSAASADARAAGLSLSTYYGQRLSLRSTGTIPAFPAQQPESKYVLVPADALARVTGGGSVGAVSVFLRGDHFDVAGLRRDSSQPALGDQGVSSVSTYAMTHDALTQGELGTLVGRGFGTAGALVACYGTLAVLIILFAGAQARGRAVSYLRTLGLSRRQARLMALIEVAPALLAASVAGWILGLILPRLLGPAIDLRPYTGGVPVTHYVPDPLQTAGLAGGLLVFAGLAVFIDAVTTARRGLGGVLRIGDT